MNNHSFKIALAGNPNVGKSTIFNSLTGLHQHTGNWSGKTVDAASGRFLYHNNTYELIDLPGTYSLFSGSKEEEIAGDYICFGNYDCIIIVADAVCLERNLNLVIQILERTSKAVLCLNMMDEARQKHIEVDSAGLSELLGVPVIGTSATKKKGLDELLSCVEKKCINSSSSVSVRKKNDLKNECRSCSETAAKQRFVKNTGFLLKIESIFSMAQKKESEISPESESASSTTPEPAVAQSDNPAEIPTPESAVLTEADPAETLVSESAASSEFRSASFSTPESRLILRPLPVPDSESSVPAAHVSLSKTCISTLYSGNIFSTLSPIVSYILACSKTSYEYALWCAIKLLECRFENSLCDKICNSLGFSEKNTADLKLIIDENFTDDEISSITDRVAVRSSEVFRDCVKISDSSYNRRDRQLDRIFTSKITGYPIMLLLLCIVFWITISGANYPSELLSKAFSSFEHVLRSAAESVHCTAVIEGIMINGVYTTLTWVVSVMLPPMAIFFPLFAILEDSGYLPRIAFNLDRYFRMACAHGKQSLTMCMGFGCNACGVCGCRIIDSPRERTIAMITNVFVPCNGRFPGLIALISIFFIGTSTGIIKSLKAAAILCLLILFGIIITLAVSKILSHTVLKGLPSSFVLELPPYRKPHFFQVFIHSFLDKTLRILGRAVVISIPAGAVIWLTANIHTGSSPDAPSLLMCCTDFLDPFAQFLGLDGVILMSFILGWPANEIVLPLIIMTYMTSGGLADYGSLEEMKMIFINNGWTSVTAICTMLFSLIHFPCATTCLTLYRESKSLKWTVAGIIIPLAAGIIVCMTANLFFSILI